MSDIRGEIVLPTADLAAEIAFWTGTPGFRMDVIYPADDPRVAVLSGHGLRLRLDVAADAPPGVIRLLSDDADALAGGPLTSPGGTRIETGPLTPPFAVPPTEHAFVVRRLRDQAPWVIGRAGMQYRDLIPDRLGGSIIASHIRIPDGGPVPDMVHFHTVGFQLIFCYRGWVDLVYEDQGPPFRLHAGNCVIQPPEIRHRVLYASDNIEVIEIGVPAEHITTIDHEMTLPNDRVNPDRRFQGQRFVHHEAEGALWAPHRLPGFVARDTTIGENTGGVAGVHVVRRGEGEAGWTVHGGDILFSFVMEGRMVLEGDGQVPHALEPGDAFVIPPGLATRYAEASEDLEILEVALPAEVPTETVPGR
ncbi:cupin domain-containing protein [Ovoidimarina sediminis]|uniref:cupin domain-containing protein n=1 Tax=Ovoidimarina sediminis TaxID=3079856 RepID=UPI00290AEC43|nr:cupin domain-containing protein [Rhodophyticola sp. MJ-SS7]MDU8942775.1 cupin domain-containing protein [Rhodophyticola sp. MJ-SS7]